MNHGRLRPDRCALELEKSGEAQTHKHQLEERQRAEEKKRTEDGDEWSPRWFRLDDELQSSLRDHEYTTEDCPPWVFKKFPEAGELAQVEAEYHDKAAETFSPWQYPDME